MEDKCVFCQIANHECNAHVVYENPFIVCFLDIDPIHEGHVLIVPKIHCTGIDELPEEMSAEVMRAFKRIVKALRSVYHFPGYSIMQNGGEFCDFGHIHFHVFPRYHDDGFGWTYGNNTPDAYTGSVAHKIVIALQMEQYD